MKKLFVFEHPLVEHKMSILRDKNTNTKEFKEIVEEISLLLCYEATKNLPLKPIEVETPLGIAKCQKVSKKVSIVPILRAGLGMVEGVLKLIPTARVGHIGLYRDPKTLKPVEYYCKLPSDIVESEVFLVDPIIATGGSTKAAISFLKEKGVEKITVLSILSSPVGIEKIWEEHPDIDIFTANCDKELTEKGYVVPGLGDAGDRIFGTK